ncbi:hypothetical protein [Candidatus Sneabacter namystus]|uniref:Uncharacterized protein n=1 Tax=Candidatus Sneabacter namystus TaxID=2601646 RepID=A0A5C0UIS4_9RICK|nr:hypothetical protein [Candidatus Sneabacter namystus]QEK39687.1 hypothetical protein FZC37_01945 [Candidatus Sneabacter namystus]
MIKEFLTSLKYLKNIFWSFFLPTIGLFIFVFFFQTIQYGSIFATVQKRDTITHISKAASSKGIKSEKIPKVSTLSTHFTVLAVTQALYEIAVKIALNHDTTAEIKYLNAVCPNDMVSSLSPVVILCNNLNKDRNVEIHESVSDSDVGVLSITKKRSNSAVIVTKKLENQGRESDISYDERRFVIIEKIYKIIQDINKGQVE